MKYRLTEEQFNQLIAESTKRILSEAMENEGFFSGLGKAWGAVKNAYQDFSDGYNGVVSNRSNGNNNNNGGQGGSWEQTQMLNKLSTEIEQLKQQIATLEGGAQQTSGTTNTQQTNVQSASTATNTQQTNPQTGNNQNTPETQNMIDGYNASEEGQGNEE